MSDQQAAAEANGFALQLDESVILRTLQRRAYICDLECSILC